VLALITMDRAVCDVSRRWAGSEKWLYRYVQSLGNMLTRTDHELYDCHFAGGKLDSTNQIPNWARGGAVTKKYYSKLIKWDILDRLNRRFAYLRRSRRGWCDFREAARNHGNASVIEYVLFLEFGVTDPMRVTYAQVEQLVRKYDMYDSYRTIWRNGRYDHMMSAHMAFQWEHTPDRQRTCSDRRLNDYLNERRGYAQSEDRVYRPAAVRVTLNTPTRSQIASFEEIVREFTWTTS